MNDVPVGDLRVELDSPRVIAEVIDDEVVAINLETGSYYSLRGSAAAIWSLLLQGRTVADVASRLGFRYEAEPDAIRIQAERFVTELLAESLLRPAEGTGGLLRGGRRVGRRRPERSRGRRCRQNRLRPSCH